MDGDYEWTSVLQLSESEMGPVQDAESLQSPESSNAAKQMPTPPSSDDGDDDLVVSVSTTFYPGAQHTPHAPDIALLSNDSVFFYVHSSVLLKASTNRFRELIPANPMPCSDGERSLVVQVPEASSILNIILHAVYDMSSGQYAPSLETLIEAIKQLPVYGIAPSSCMGPAMPLHTHLLSYAPLFPLEVYAVAASFDLYDLASSASSHLLSYPLSTISDEMAVRIGPIYLKRLFFLHVGRSDALKRLLLAPPHPHAPTPVCDFTQQKKLARAWALAAAYLAWDARPDMSVSTIESSLRPLGTHLSCRDCKDTFEERIRTLVVQWSIVKRDI